MLFLFKLAYYINNQELKVRTDHEKADYLFNN